MVFPEFQKKWGKPIESREVPSEIIESYKGLLPEQLIQLWQEDGWGGYIEGLAWTINPNDYQEYLKKWLIIDYEAYPFMRSAFGDLIILYRDIAGDINVDLIDVRHQILKTITPSGLAKFFETIATDDGRFLGTIRGLLLLDAPRKLGKLHYDECYGFEPILALGGEETLEHLKIVKFAPHLEILTQALEKPIEW